MAEALIDVVARLRTVPDGDRFEPGPTIFATPPISPDSAAIVIAEDAVNGVSPSEPAFEYLLEVATAVEVLDVWSSWREGRKPSRADAVAACHPPRDQQRLRTGQGAVTPARRRPSISGQVGERVGGGPERVVGVCRAADMRKCGAARRCRLRRITRCRGGSPSDR